VQNPRTDIVNEFIDFPDDNETDLQSLLNQLSTECVTVQEYVNLENSVQFNDTLTVEDIVQTIQEPLYRNLEFLTISSRARLDIDTSLQRSRIVATPVRARNDIVGTCTQDCEII